MLEKAKKAKEDQKKRWEADAHAKAATYHRAFVQNEHGKKILDNWVRQFCMKSIPGDASSFQCGKAEGKREMIEEILDHISHIENES